MKRYIRLIGRQHGMALPMVLAMFAIGSLLIVPSINYIATNLNAGTITEQEFKGIITADAGIEDALWKIKNDTPNLLEPYQITDINGMSIDVDIDEVEVIGGVSVEDPEHHADWLQVSANVTYDYSSGNYTYIISAHNTDTSQIKIERIVIDFPSGVDYVPNSTSSNLTQPQDMNPTSIFGSSATGITLVWENGTPRPNIAAGDTEYHYFKLSGPPDIPGIEGHGFVEAKRSDISAVWIGDIAPYSITAKARDSSGTVVAEIRAGVWGSSYWLDITCWQVLH